VKVICGLSVNGERVEVAVEPATTLLETLRYSVGLTGSKQGCDKGDCGACTVLVDGQPVLSCLTLALMAQGREIVTVEGLAERGQGAQARAVGSPHPLQDAFDRWGAAQCGFCTPGMLMSAAALLDKNPQPTRLEIREALAGNLCRCTGYVKIIDAVEDAARMLSEAKNPTPTHDAQDQNKNTGGAARDAS
jgi:aerobic-type carbon monoxide dehydrogenase small subunit (CoxS/CutS family)